MITSRLVEMVIDFFFLRLQYSYSSLFTLLYQPIQHITLKQRCYNVILM